MVAELGQYALIIAFMLSVLLSIVPMWGSFKGDVNAMASARWLSIAQFIFVAFSFVCLTVNFAQDDFSVAYVSQHSNSLLPMQYKISAVWGGHEGSMLLWILILAGWTLAVALFSKDLPADMQARVLSVMGMVAVGFLAFSLFTSNPFERNLPFAPQDGSDLNPLLQDVGLIIHPPMLYLGYVGFSVAFAFAIAALIGGHLDTAWARWTRPWTNMAWVFLTLGIGLGSWWAYYELGWGGWWFWDPVENASFMPWLVGTALVHSLAVTEKRGLFRSWTVLLAIFAFSLSLLGTFLVRSGVLTSVHAFANDPERGLFILIFLFVVIGASLALYALRAPTLHARASYDLLSREVFLLINNVIFLAATIAVLVGTLFPLLADALQWGKYSVGAAYFNAAFVPLMSLAMVFLGLGARLNWKRNRSSELAYGLVLPLVATLLTALLFPQIYAGEFSIWVSGGVLLAGWVIASGLADIRHKLRNAPSVGAGLKRLPASYWGMQLGHMGFAVLALGVCLTVEYSVERDVYMRSGDNASVAGYSFNFEGTEQSAGPNYTAHQGIFKVDENGSELVLKPEKRRYLAGNQMMTEAAIDAGFTRDVFVALGEPREEGGWAVRLHVKPFVRWLWLGALIIALGGFVAVLDKRYRRKGSAE